MATIRKVGGRRLGRSSNRPVVVVLCFLVAVVGLLVSLFGTLHVTSVEEYSLLSSLESSTLKAVSCVKLVEESQQNPNDENQNRLFLRYTKDEPRFWISLHDKNFDPPRWQVMHYGRYYEQVQVRYYL